jgi:hypothetical protein
MLVVSDKMGSTAGKEYLKILYQHLSESTKELYRKF